MGLVLKSAFEIVMGKSSSPDLCLSKRFQEAWSFIDQTNYQASHTAWWACEKVHLPCHVQQYSGCQWDAVPPTNQRWLPWAQWAHNHFPWEFRSKEYTFDVLTAEAFHHARWMSPKQQFWNSKVTLSIFPRTSFSGLFLTKQNVHQQM